MIVKIALVLVVVATTASGPRLRCDVQQKVDPNGPWSASRVEASQSYVLLDDSADGAARISRCSYARSQGRVTCDTLLVDHVVTDAFGGTKYYDFDSLFDLQIIPGGSFVENNGRESIALGQCREIG